MNHLCTPLDGAASVVASPAYTTGSGQVGVAAGTGPRFGTPSASAPVRVTMVAASALDAQGRITDWSKVGIYRCTGRTTDTLTGLVFESGVDQAFSAGDFVGVLVNAASIADLHALQPWGSVLMYGAVGDGVTDDSAAIQAAFDANPGGRVYFPKRSGVATSNTWDYYCASSIFPKGYGTVIEGASGGYSGGTTLKFPAGVTGIDLLQANGGNTAVRNLTLYGAEPSFAGTTPALQLIPNASGTITNGFGLDGLPVVTGGSTADGIRVGQVNVTLENVWVHQFGRHGISFIQDATHLTDCVWVVNSGGVACLGHGIAVAGGDSNAGTVMNCSFLNDQCWGVYDQSFLGNTYEGGQTASNGVDGSALTGWPLIAVTGAVRSSNVTTVTTATPHGFAVDDYISTGAFTGTDAATFDALVYHTVASVPTSTTFTYAETGANTSASGTGQTSWQPIAITTLVRATNVVTLTASHAHHLSVGNVFSVRGATDATFSGLFKVASVTSTTILTYSQVAGNASTSSGLVSLYPTLATASPTGYSRASNVVTVTFGSPHTWKPGQMMWLLGVADTSFNGAVLVQTVTSNTFTFNQTGSNATSTGGTLYLLRSGDGMPWLGIDEGPFKSATALGCTGSTFIGCYSEGDQSPSKFGAPNLIIGGDHGAGWDRTLNPATIFTSGGGYQQLTLSFPVLTNGSDATGVIHLSSGHTSAQAIAILCEGNDTSLMAANVYASITADSTSLKLWNGIGINTYGSLGTVQLTVDADGVLFGPGGLSTSSTAGFPYVPSVAGTPTGVPSAHSGYAPLIFDTSANKLWVYNGGWQSASGAGDLSDITDDGTNHRIGVNEATPLAALDVNSSGTARVMIGDMFPGAAGTYGGLLVGTSAPSGTNYMLMSDGSSVFFNAPAGTLNFRIANANVVTVLATGLVGVTQTIPVATLHSQATSSAHVALIAQGATSQAVDLQQWTDSTGTVLARVKLDGSVGPAHMADTAAANDSVYYSTTAGKLVYKDGSGTVNNLYP